jgi:hypothetical protein
MTSLVARNGSTGVGTMTAHPAQLELDLHPETVERLAVATALQCGLRDPRHLPAGPARLLATLVAGGLPEHALMPAAAFCVALARLANGGE